MPLVQAKCTHKDMKSISMKVPATSAGLKQAYRSI